MIVVAKKPREGTLGFVAPPVVPGQTGGRNARADGGPGLKRLLVEWLGLSIVRTECLRSNRSEVPARSGLQLHQPAERVEACFEMGQIVRRLAAHHERLAQASVIISQPVLEPVPLWFGGVDPALEQATGEIVSQAFEVAVAGESLKKVRYAEKTIGPCAG